MPTHQPLVPCPQSKVIRKYIRDVPCSKMKPKKKREVPCPTGERKRSSKQIEEVTRCNQNRVQSTLCPAKQQEAAPKCVQNPVCPGKERKVTGCPKCESNRIQKLESEVYQLRKDIECMKYERKETEKAIQKAIIRGAKALGGRLLPMVPNSVEKLLDTCNSGVSSRSSLTICTAKSMPPSVHACQYKPAKKREVFDYCGACGL